MPALVAGIHVFVATWRFYEDVDCRVKPGNDASG
jgi:hypothetical protein